MRLSANPVYNQTTHSPQTQPIKGSNEYFDFDFY
jgi:hypothetical protein